MYRACFGETESGSTVVRNTILLGFALAVSLALLLVAGIVGNNWLPMLNLGAVVLVPMAVIVSDVMGGNATAGGACGAAGGPRVGRRAAARLLERCEPENVRARARDSRA